MRKFSQFLFIIVFSLFCFLSIPAQNTREELEVLNIEIPVRVMYKGKPVDNLKKSEFSLFENGKKIDINGFSLIKNKISNEHEVVKREGKGEKRRLFVLAFSITNFNRSYEKGVKYLFDKILKRSDSLIIMINNVMFTYNELKNKQYIYGKIVSSLKEEGRKARSNLLGIFRSVELSLRMLKTELEISGKEYTQAATSSMHNKHILFFLRAYKSAWDDFKGRFLFSDLAPYYNLSEFLKKRNGEKWAVNFYQMEKFPMLDPTTEIYQKIVSGAGIIGSRIIKQIEKEFDAERGFPADDVGKMFASSGVRFDMVLVPSRVESNTSGIISGDISTSIENTLRKIADLTGGKKTLSSNIEKVFSEMEKREDIVYMLTYEPSDSAERGKIKIKLQNKKYKIIYDRNRKAGFITRFIGAKKKKPANLSIRNIHFRKRILNFRVPGFEKRGAGKSTLGRLKLNVVVKSDRDGRIAHSKDMYYRPAVSPLPVSIDLAGLEKGEYHVMIDLSDQNSGRTTFEYFRMKVRRLRNDVVEISGSGSIENSMELPETENTLNKLELDGILEGAAVYCKKLERSAFHFFCREQILSRASRLVRVNRRFKSERLYIHKYLLDYQLIKSAAGVREQRKNITGNKRGSERDFNKMITSFLSERPVFAPIMILGSEGQKKFRFTLEKIWEKDKRKIARIKAVPKTEREFFFTSARIDVDTLDYSVLRIHVVPRYINGYEDLLHEAFNLGSKLYLEADIRFDKLYRELRFPTYIGVFERYRGGAIVMRAAGVSGFIKSRTEFKYTDYRFFNVDMDIKN